MAAYLHHQGISVILYLDDWLIHHRDRQVLLCHQSQLLKTLDLVGLKLNEEKSELDLVQDPVSRASLTPESRESITPRIHMHVHAKYPLSQFVYTSVPTHRVTQLGFSSHPTGSLHLRQLQRHFYSLGLTSRFTPLRRLDQPVLCQRYLLYTGLGRPIWGIPRFWVLGPIQTASPISTVWNSKLSIPPLPRWVTVLQGRQVISTNRAGPIPTPCYI